MRCGYCSDLHVGDADPASGAPSVGHDAGEALRGIAVEKEDSATEETAEDAVRRVMQFRTPCAGWQPGHLATNFSF